MSGKIEEIEVFDEKPDDFCIKVNTVACYLQVCDEILMLKRSAHKDFGNEWGLPAGKMEDGETQVEAMLREVVEETGIVISQKESSFVKTIYVRNRYASLAFHMYCVQRDVKPEVTLNDENCQYGWFNKTNIYELDLMPGATEALAKFNW